jgi:DNA end-binding protein Ku
MRSMWKGSVGFGMVNVPVKLYKAMDDESADISLCNTHRECGTPVKAPRYCPTCTKFLSPEEMQKAYPMDSKKTKLLPISESELDGIALPSIHSINIDGFIDAIPDVRYFDNVYILEPEETGMRAFSLFEKAIAGKVGIAKITIGSSEHLCAVYPTGDGLLFLVTLHWSTEIRETMELKRPKVEATDREVKMAKMLVGALPKVDLKNYKNEYGAALRKLIDDKVAGKIPSILNVAKPTAEDDLINQLMASLKAVEGVV